MKVENTTTDVIIRNQHITVTVFRRGVMRSLTIELSRAEQAKLAKEVYAEGVHRRLQRLVRAHL